MYMYKLSVGNVNVLRSYFDMYFTVPDEFTEYADGIISGVADTIPLWSSVYNREIDALDLYIVSSVPDLSAVVDLGVYCSSVSSWGNSTLDDEGSDKAKALISTANEEISALRKATQAKVDKKVDEARAHLEAESDTLCIAIMEKILDRRPG